MVSTTLRVYYSSHKNTVWYENKLTTCCRIHLSAISSRKLFTFNLAVSLRFTFFSVSVVNTLKCGELAFRCGSVVNSFSFMKKHINKAVEMSPSDSSSPLRLCSPKQTKGLISYFQVGVVDFTSEKVNFCVLESSQNKKKKKKTCFDDNFQKAKNIFCWNRCY